MGIKNSRNNRLWIFFLFLFLVFSLYGAEITNGKTEAAHAHGGPVIPVLLGIFVILVVGKSLGLLATSFGQPSVLGELIAGVILGNLYLIGIDWFEFIKTDTGIEVLAELGVIVLLFFVGLESRIEEMLSVGLSSTLVAVLGVVAPFLFGWVVSAIFIPEEVTLVHVFIGATLCATSVGITARVLTDLGKIKTKEAGIILGAAVIDDVLGLIILSVVSGAIIAANAGTTLSLGSITIIIIKALIFLVLSIFLGLKIAKPLLKPITSLHQVGLLPAYLLAFASIMAYLANQIGLAAIVGAFAAGLVLEEVEVEATDKPEKTKHIYELEAVISPILYFLTPIFFVRMGSLVDITTFANVSILGFAFALTLVAILGKMACYLGVVTPGADKLSIALGMVPRGEVGLIFASIGASLKINGHPVISSGIYSAVVIMVIVTTLITPPLLTWSFGRKKI